MKSTTPQGLYADHLSLAEGLAFWDIKIAEADDDFKAAERKVDAFARAQVQPVSLNSASAERYADLKDDKSHAKSTIEKLREHKIDDLIQYRQNLIDAKAAFDANQVAYVEEALAEAAIKGIEIHYE